MSIGSLGKNKGSTHNFHILTDLPSHIYPSLVVLPGIHLARMAWLTVWLHNHAMRIAETQNSSK